MNYAVADSRGGGGGGKVEPANTPIYRQILSHYSN